MGMVTLQQGIEGLYQEYTEHVEIQQRDRKKFLIRTLTFFLDGRLPVFKQSVRLHATNFIRGLRLERWAMVFEAKTEAIIGKEGWMTVRQEESIVRGVCRRSCFPNQMKNTKQVEFF